MEMHLDSFLMIRDLVLYLLALVLVWVITFKSNYEWWISLILLVYFLCSFLL